MNAYAQTKAGFVSGINVINDHSHKSILKAFSNRSQKNCKLILNKILFFDIRIYGCDQRFATVEKRRWMSLYQLEYNKNESAILNTKKDWFTINVIEKLAKRLHRMAFRLVCRTEKSHSVTVLNWPLLLQFYIQYDLYVECNCPYRYKMTDCNVFHSIIFP